MDLDFNELINNYLSQDKKEKTIGRYYPSEIGSCLRKTWFSYKIPKETDKELLKIFEAGNNLHELVSKILESEKNPHIELIETELPFKQDEGDFTISGRIDNLILLKENNEKIIVEVKSTKTLPERPKKDHISQLQLYMHNLQISKGVVLYVQKDNLQTQEFNINYNKEKYDEIIRRFHGLHHCLKLDIIPPAESKLVKNQNWMCNYCEYRKDCDRYPNE